MVSYPVENGKTFSPVLGRKVAISAPMQRLLNALTVHGDVDTIRDGGTVGTVVALMKRGILREATPRSHGKGSGHHYPETTPAQVWDDAHTEYREVTREARKADADAYQRELAQNIQDGNYTIVMGEPVVTPAQAHQRAVQEAAEAYNRGDIDDDGNWRSEDAVVRSIPLPAPQSIGITDADGNALVMGDVVRVDGDATLYGTVYRGDGDDMWGVPLGGEREQRIDATRMRRVERGADGSFPPAAPSLTDEPPYSDEDVARICWAANATLMQINGDEHADGPWEDAPEWVRANCIVEVRDARAHGANAPDMHAAWVALKLVQGWTWGPVRDAGKREHPSIVLDYADVPDRERAKDALWLGIVAAFPLR